MILVIDDSPEDLFFHRRMIRKIDPKIEVKEFAYAEDALEFIADLESPVIKLILLDINLPRINGFEFLRRYDDLQAGFRDSPEIYVMSGSIDPQDRDTATSLDSVNGYLPKPLKFDVLRDIILSVQSLSPTATA